MTRRAQDKAQLISRFCIRNVFFHAPGYPLWGNIQAELGCVLYGLAKVESIAKCCSPRFGQFKDINRFTQGMIGLLGKIKSLTQGTDFQRGTPFISVRSTQKWLKSLPDSSDYDVHHVLVEGLERYNGDTRGDAYTRIRVLEMIEEAGLPLQARLVDQYLKNHEGNDTSRQTLWRECHLFWDQLAVAYLPFLSLVLGNDDAGKLSSLTAEIAAKSLRYISLCMRWEYLRGRRPAEPAWRRLHKIYRATESASIALDDVEIGGSKTTCAREYVMTLLFDLANPYAFGPAEIQPALHMLDSLRELPVPESGLRHGRHSHMVDLAASSGPERIDDRWVPGGRLRYLDMRGGLDELERSASQTPDAALAAVCKKLIRVIGRAGSTRSGPRRPRFGEVRAVFGAEEVLRIFSPFRGVVPNTEYITLRDESSKGVGFVLNEERELQPGSLLSIDRDEGHGAWQLLTVRWLAVEDMQWLLGTEVLSRYPKRVDIEWEADTASKETAVALFLPLAGPSQGAISNLLVPQHAYQRDRELLLHQDDGTRYRLRLGDIVEPHESWLRVVFDVLSRETAEGK